MTAVFFSNFLLGFVLAMELGQVSVEIFRRGTRFGFRQAVLVSAGGAAADFIYLNLTAAGVIIFLDSPSFLGPMWLLGGMAMTYLALSGLKTAAEEVVGESGMRGEKAGTGPFAAGLGLNFLHPLNLVWWITILGSIIIADTQKNSALTAYLDGMGIVLGVLTWWLILSLLASRLKERLKVEHLRPVFTVSSFVLLGFGIWFFYNAHVIFTG